MLNTGVTNTNTVNNKIKIFKAIWTGHYWVILIWALPNCYAAIHCTEVRCTHSRWYRQMHVWNKNAREILISFQQEGDTRVLCIMLPIYCFHCTSTDISSTCTAALFAALSKQIVPFPLFKKPFSTFSHLFWKFVSGFDFISARLNKKPQINNMFWGHRLLLFIKCKELISQTCDAKFK